MIYRHRVLSFFVCSFFATSTFFLSPTSQALKRALAIRRHATNILLQEHASQSQAISNPAFGRFNEHYHVHYHQRTKTQEELKFNQKFNWNTHFTQEVLSGLAQRVDYFQVQKHHRLLQSNSYNTR